MNIKLTIAVITYNRAAQLIEAIESCIICKKPFTFEIVIVDNASTDCTESEISKLIESNPEISIKYERQLTNLGVGGGRTRAFELSDGEYVYFMDDDAIIDPKNKDSFFVNPIGIMDNDRSIATLTTAIFDEYFGDSRNCKIITGDVNADGTFDIYRYNGGSHFLRHSVFKTPLYPPVKYANEELVPAIIAADKGLRNVYYGDVQIIHKPIVKKWKDVEAMNSVNIQSVCNKFALKALLYPIVFYPILRFSFEIRCFKQLRFIPSGRKNALSMAKEVIESNGFEKVSFLTVIKLYRKFGSQVF